MTKSLDNLRRDAKALQAAYETGAADARARVAHHIPVHKSLKRADFLHVIAREQTYTSWPMMKEAVTRLGLDRAGRQQRLKIALANGQTQLVKSLVTEDAQITEGAFALKCALYDVEGVRAWIARDPRVVQQVFGPRGRPIHHLAFSRAHQISPDRAADALVIAEMLVTAGADMNDVFTPPTGPMQSAIMPLYGAVAFAKHMPLAQWFLDHGANPDDNESLYHACEIGHAEGLRMLIKAGANPNGTNALKRAMDFDNVEMVGLLLEGGADPNEGHYGWTALHHAALRMSSDKVCQLLVDAGADQDRLGHGITAYAAAKVYGNQALAGLLAPKPLSAEEALLAQAASGHVPDDVYIDPNKIPDIYLGLVREFAATPSKLDHIKALIKLGLPWDRGDGSGVTPVQIAGWCGRPEMLAYFLSLKPDLGHKNAFGGGLFGTITNGVMQHGDGDPQDYIACFQLILDEGVALPKLALKTIGMPAVKTFLEDWAARHPGQVVAHGYG